MRLFIFGAGATIGTLGRPGVKGFGKALERAIPKWRSRPEFGSLASAVDQLEPKDKRSTEDWDLDALWTRVDYLAKLAPALGVQGYPPQTSMALHASVTAVYGPLDPRPLHRAYDDRNAPFTMRDVCAQVRPGDMVVSFNWDTLVEVLLTYHLRQSDVRLVQYPFPYNSKSVRFAKPHGSLSWGRGHLDRIDDGAGAPRLAAVEWGAVLQDSACEPLLLGAVPIKSELIKEVHSRQHSLIMEQWRCLCDGVTGATEIYVVGYGFPPEDGYGRYLIHEAARRRTHRTKIALYEHPLKVKDVTKAIVEVLAVDMSEVKDCNVVIGPQFLCEVPKS